jgi:HTH-type transcriptional repressor of puuD
MNDATLAPGRRLSQIRQELGLSQRRVAELSGLTHSAISTIEQDKVSRYRSFSPNPKSMPRRG